jgi:hypothetical protein
MSEPSSRPQTVRNCCASFAPVPSCPFPSGPLAASVLRAGSVNQVYAARVLVNGSNNAYVTCILYTVSNTQGWPSFRVVFESYEHFQLFKNLKCEARPVFKNCQSPPRRKHSASTLKQLVNDVQRNIRSDNHTHTHTGRMRS